MYNGLTVLISPLGAILSKPDLRMRQGTRMTTVPMGPATLKPNQSPEVMAANAD